MLINILAFIILCSVPGYFSFDYLDSSPTFPDDNSHEQIDHTLILAKHISNLYLSESYKDVDLDIDGEEVPAHRILLASRSENFGALLYGEDGKPYTNNVKISETPVALFMILLKYTYTGQVNLSDLEDTAVFKLGRISEYFGFFDLKHSLQEYSNEQIDHVHLLVSDISNLYLSKSYSDVVLVVGGEEFHAHRFLLASRSYYFGVLLFGGHRETYDKKVPINDVPVNLFKKLLKYIYTGLVVLSDLEGLDVLEFYRISDLFGFLDLTNSLNDYLQTTFEAENVCSFFVITRSFQYKKLIDASLDFIDNNAEDVLTADGFLSLPLEALQEIIIRDSFYTNEFEIFHAVCRWIHQKHDDLDHYSKVKVLSAVRYSLMSADEMSKAMKSKLVGSDIISEAIQKRKTSSPEHQFRGQRKPNVSLYFAPLKLTNGNLIPWVERLHGHNDDEDLDGGYNVIRFDNRTLINYIEIKLWNISTSDDQRYYSYDIEVSMDGYNWTRVINHSNYNCRSLQRLWIQPRIVQYIHVVGSKSDPNVTFKFCGVQYNTNEMHMVEINNGFVVPKINYKVTSSFFNNAIVVKGEHSYTDYSLLDDFYNDDNDTDERKDIYTYHRLGDGFIVVHLAQPYILSSIRLLLWGDHNQFYSYRIESSLNNLVWDMVIDKSKELTQSWQLLKFNPRPMLYIRITGTRSSPSNVKDFRCVYLEGPAQVT